MLHALSCQANVPHFVLFRLWANFQQFVAIQFVYLPKQLFTALFYLLFVILKRFYSKGSHLLKQCFVEIAQGLVLIALIRVLALRFDINYIQHLVNHSGLNFYIVARLDNGNLQLQQGALVCEIFIHFI